MLVRGLSREELLNSSVCRRPAAVSTLNEFHAALDGGMQTASSGVWSLGDLAIIACGWAVLLLVIAYPAIQLAAIATCAAALVLRWLVFGSNARPAEVSVRAW